MIGYDEVIKEVIYYGKILGYILGNVYVITLGIVVVTELVSLNGSFGGSYYCKHQENEIY